MTNPKTAAQDTTCYIERSEVRQILITSNADNEATREILRDIDALPIFNAGDFRSDVQIASDWRSMETAPRDGSRMLATGGGLGETVDIVSYNDRVGAWDTGNYTLDDRDDEADGYSRPDRWMPLPVSSPLPSAQSNSEAPKPGDAASRGALAQTLLDEGIFDDNRVTVDSYGLADAILEHWDVRWKSAPSLSSTDGKRQ